MTRASEFTLRVVRVFVTDWERAVRFYTQTLGIPASFRSDEMGWAQLATGEGELALELARPDDAEARDLVGRFLGVSLQVPDLDATYARLVERGVEFLEPPARQAWGGVLAHLRDPDGNVVTLLGPPA